MYIVEYWSENRFFVQSFDSPLIAFKAVEIRSWWRHCLQFLLWRCLIFQTFKYNLRRIEAFHRKTVFTILDFNAE